VVFIKFGNYKSCKPLNPNPMSNLKAIEYDPFEAIKHITEDGFEFWNARELANVLEYVQWAQF